jgi:hypothetical protein
MDDTSLILSDRAQVIVCLEAACRAIAEARDVRDVKEIRDQAMAVGHYARERNLGKQLMTDAAEIKIRAERRMGELLKVMPKAKGGQPYQKATPSTLEGVAPTLASLGVTEQDSHRCQRMAKLDDKAFETHIAETRADPKGELTTAGVLREVAKQSPPVKPPKSWNTVEESEAIGAWLQARMDSWPASCRGDFFEFVRRILANMEECLS